MDTKTIAAEILKARQTETQTQMAMPDPALTLPDAQDIQTEVFAQLGSPIVGWKVGAANEAAQQAFGLDAPFYGPMPQSAVLENGSNLRKSACVGANEPEYAFKMARDYPAEGEAVTAETAADAVASLHPAIEVIGRAMGHSDFANGIGVTMDFGGNVAFLAGPAIEDWQDQDIVNSPVLSVVDGKTVHTGSGAAVMGDPMASLVWMAQTLADQGRQLKAGEWVSTGTCTPAVPAEAGTTYTADFGKFGTVSINFI